MGVVTPIGTRTADPQVDVRRPQPPTADRPRLPGRERPQYPSADERACNRCTYGKRRKGITYYCCQPEANNRGRPDTYADHPKTAYVREDLLPNALAAFYTDHVLRPHRPDLLPPPWNAPNAATRGNAKANETG